MMRRSAARVGTILPAPVLRGVLWLVLAAIAHIVGVPAANAAFDEPVLLAERTIELDRGPRDGLITEFIDVPPSDQRFGAVLLATSGGTLDVKAVRVTGGAGLASELSVDTPVVAGAAAVEVALPDGDGRITRVEVLYRRSPSTPAATTVLLRVTARPLEAVAPGPGAVGDAGAAAMRPPAGSVAKPGATSQKDDPAALARLVRLTSRRIDLARPDIVMPISGDVGPVSALQVRALDLPVIMRAVTLRFSDGRTREVAVGQLIEAGGASRLIPLGEAQPLREVVVQVRARTAQDSGTLEIWGDTGGARTAALASRPVEQRPAEQRAAARSQVDRQTLPPPQVSSAERAGEVYPGPRGRDDRRAGRGDERNWRLLGAAREEEGSGRGQRAVFQIRSVPGQITAVRLLPRRDIVRITDARVEFADGSSQRLDVRGYELEPGQMTEVIPLSERRPPVVRVEVFYRALSAFEGPAVLELWARIEPEPGERRSRTFDPQAEAERRRTYELEE